MAAQVVKSFSVDSHEPESESEGCGVELNDLAACDIIKTLFLQRFWVSDKPGSVYANVIKSFIWDSPHDLPPATNPRI